MTGWNVSKLAGDGLMHQWTRGQRSPRGRAWPPMRPIGAAAIACGLAALAAPAQCGVPPPGDLRDLGHELVDQGMAEGVVALRHHDEGAGAADDIVAIVGGEFLARIDALWISRVRRLAGDDQPVNRRALVDRVVARLRDHAAAVVDPVAGHVDGAALRFIRCALQLRRGEIERGADRRAAGKRTRRLRELVDELARRGLVADDRPVDHDLLRRYARPLDEGRRDATVDAGADRLEHPRIG